MDTWFRVLALSYSLSMNPAHLSLHWRPLTIPSGLLEAYGLTAYLSLWAVNSVVLHYEKKKNPNKENILILLNLFILLYLLNKNDSLSISWNF